jgi:orotate phosphoribosyltransferase
MIEGEVQSGQSVIVIEDLVSTGGSSLKAVEALRASGCNVKGMVAIFSYGFKEATENFKKSGCMVKTLCDYNVLIEEALHRKFISEKDVESLKQWRDNPSQWGVMAN